MIIFQKVKESLIVCRPTVEEIDRENGPIVRKCKKEQAEQIKRVLEKLKDEWTAVNKTFKDRNDR